MKPIKMYAGKIDMHDYPVVTVTTLETDAEFSRLLPRTLFVCPLGMEWRCASGALELAHAILTNHFANPNKVERCYRVFAQRIARTIGNSGWMFDATAIDEAIQVIEWGMERPEPAAVVQLAGANA